MGRLANVGLLCPNGSGSRFTHLVVPCRYLVGRGEFPERPLDIPPYTVTNNTASYWYTIIAIIGKLEHIAHYANSVFPCIYYCCVVKGPEYTLVSCSATDSHTKTVF